MFLKRNKTIIASITILILSSTSLLVIMKYVNESDVERFLTGLNVLFSGGALIGLIVSYRLQQKEQLAQRKEFTFDRLTNILFKQIDRPNQILESISFYDLVKNSNNSQVDFNTFFEKIENLNNKRKDRTLGNTDRQKAIKNLHLILDINKEEFERKINDVYKIFDNYNNLLTNSILEESEIKELRFLLWDNLNYKWSKLTITWLDFLRREVNYINNQNKDKLRKQDELNEPLRKIKIMNIDIIKERIAFINSFQNEQRKPNNSYK